MRIFRLNTPDSTRFFDADNLNPTALVIIYQRSSVPKSVEQKIVDYFTEHPSVTLNHISDNIRIGDPSIIDDVPYGDIICGQYGDSTSHLAAAAVPVILDSPMIPNEVSSLFE